MGKGKRNRQLHLENTVGAPVKRQNKAKKQIVLPKWAKLTICIVLLVAIVGGIVAASLINGGIVYRNRILVESKSGKFDVNQHTAAFILWQTMYQQAFYEYYYTQWGMYQDTNKILTNYLSANDYAVMMATNYTNALLKTGITSIQDYLMELVAGADAALDAGLKLEAHDKEEVTAYVEQLQSYYLQFQSEYVNETNTLGYTPSTSIWQLRSALAMTTFKNFLGLSVGDTFQMSDIEKAAKLMIMYSKYVDYKSLDIDDDATPDELQDFILKNPSGHFESKYYTYTGATVEMLREFFGEKFMDDRAKSTFAKHFANIDRLAIADLKDDALKAKLEELGLNNPVEYTKTTTDGESTYSPELNEKIAEYVFSTSNKAGTFAAISGEDCAYLIYFDKTSTTEKATIAFKEYKYEDYTDELATIADLDKLMLDCIKAGENVTDYKSSNDFAEELLAKLNDNKEMAMPEGSIVANVTSESAKDEANTVPTEILNILYGKDANVTENWNFVSNNNGTSYVVKVTAIEKDAEGKPTTNYTISYVTFEDELFYALLRSFEAEFKLYMLDSKVEAPTYSLPLATFKEKVLDWLMDQNLEELVLTKYANDAYDVLTEAKKDSNKEVFENALKDLGINKNTYGGTTQFKKEIDSKLYDFLFNTKNQDTFSVIVGDDGVYLAYVYPHVHEEGDDHDHDSGVTVVEAGWKKFELADCAINYSEIYESIRKDLASDDRKNTTDHKSADDLAKVEYDALTKKEDPKAWPTEGVTAVTTTKPLTSNDTNTAPSAILTKIYGSSSTTATKIQVELNAYYQVNASGTSYVFKVIEVPAADDTKLTTKIEYLTFEDSEYYSYFRAIQTKLNNSFKKDASTLSHPATATDGTYQAWLSKGEYKEAEGDNAASREFDRVKDDYTFIATTDSSNNITGATIYLVDEPMTQVKKEDVVVYGAYLEFGSEKAANKAYKQIKDKVGFELLDKFTSLKATEENGTGDPIVTSATIDFALTKDSVTDENLENWLFSADRKAGDIAVVEGKDGGFYLVTFVSSEQTWLRTARTSWVDAEVKAHLQDLVKEGGYEMNQDSLNKIEEVTTAATTPATTTPTATK